MADRERQLARIFVRLANTLVDDFDVVELLHELTASAVRLIGAETAGVMIADARGSLRLVASSEERMRLLEVFELQGAEGPCLDAFDSGALVLASAAEAARRWPSFAPAAASAGFLFICAVPLTLRGAVLGALNLFRSTDEPFTADEMEIAQAMAEVASISLLQQRALNEQTLLAEQLQSALQSRVVIEQAKGMIAEHLSVDVDDAFGILRSHARNNNLKLSEFARAIATRSIGSETLSVTPEPGAG